MTPPSDAERAAMEQEAAARFRAFGEGLFTVDELKIAGHRDLILIEYFYESKLHEVALDARIQLPRDLHVRAREEIAARVGAPDWTREERDRDVVLLSLFGPGDRKAGSASLRAAAMFDDLEPGWRFRLVDAPYPGESQYESGAQEAR